MLLFCPLDGTLNHWKQKNIMYPGKKDVIILSTRWDPKSLGTKKTLCTLGKRMLFVLKQYGTLLFLMACQYVCCPWKNYLYSITVANFLIFFSILHSLHILVVSIFYFPFLVWLHNLYDKICIFQKNGFTSPE